MKKVIILLFLLSLAMPVYAGGFKDFIKKQFMPADQKFVIVEEEVRAQTLRNLNKRLEDFYYMRDEHLIELFSQPLLLRDISFDAQTNIGRMNEFKEQNFKNFDEAFNLDKRYIQQMYAEFMKNKNNMEKNKEICDDIYDDFIVPYNKISEYIKSIYNEELFNYRKTLYNRTSNLTLQAKDGKYYGILNCGETCPDPKKVCRTQDRIYMCNLVFDELNNVSIIENAEELIKLNSINNDLGYKIATNFNKNAKYVQDIQNEIKDYSIKYETQKLKNYYKNYRNIKKCNGTFATYFSLGSSPQKGCYYDVFVEIFQKVPGGYFAFDPNEYAGIGFIETNKNIPRGKQFWTRLLYQGGTYSYTSLLGEYLTVYKYKIINTPKEQFYFINK